MSRGGFIGRAGLLLLFVVQPSCGADLGQQQPAVGKVGFSCFDTTTAGAGLLEQKTSGHLEASSLAHAIQQLNEGFGLPVSVIESEAPGAHLSIDATDTSVRQMLRQIIDSAPSYQCRLIENRIVVFEDAPGLHETIRDVAVVGQPRWIAADIYVQKVAEQVADFRGLHVSFGGVLDAPIINDVTLSRQATVLEHLVQLLGRDRKVFFWIRRTPTGSRSLTFGAAR